jgi:hypothetical protein
MHKGNNLTVQFSRRNFGNTLKKKSMKKKSDSLCGAGVVHFHGSWVAGLYAAE